VSGDESSVPAEHGRGIDYQEHLGEASTVQRAGDRGEDRAVGLGEPRSRDLALQDQDLMTQGEDLDVAFVARGEQPTDPMQYEAGEGGNQSHRSTVRGPR
jgi:hypothetical protein